MTIASAFNDIAVAQGGTASKSGAITAAIDALNDALAGSDQPAAKTIEQAVRLLGEHIGGGGGGGSYEWTSMSSIMSVGPNGDAPTMWALSQKSIIEEFPQPTVPYMFFEELLGAEVPVGMYCTLFIPEGLKLSGIYIDGVQLQDYEANELAVSFVAAGEEGQVEWETA